MNFAFRSVFSFTELVLCRGESLATTSFVFISREHAKQYVYINVS